MRKRLAFALFGLLAALVVPMASVGVGWADSVSVFPSGCGADICKDNSAGAKSNPIFGPQGIMTEIIHILAIFVGVVAVISIIVAGFMMITAAGDSTKVSNARRALLYAIMGLVVAAIAQTIVVFVLDRVAP
ncbi:MAG TPA: hypothetical protein VJR27_05010 [Candidatus Saccharimonadales bacterium]|nr:hypothetical protein [Candidatus Saccharimonadales bacterium]